MRCLCQASPRNTFSVCWDGLRFRLKLYCSLTDYSDLCVSVCHVACAGLADPWLCQPCETSGNAWKSAYLHQRWNREEHESMSNGLFQRLVHVAFNILS